VFSKAGGVQKEIQPAYNVVQQQQLPWQMPSIALKP
jgi:hypothetical protein